MFNITVEEVKSLPSGRVLHRWKTPKGSHQKMRLTKSIVYRTCDICKHPIEGLCVKTEAGGNHTLLTQCIGCAVDELNSNMNLLH
jgi:hypothetical protein